MRNIEARKEKGDKEAKLAFEMCAYRIKKYIGAYMVVLKKSRCDHFYRGIRGKLLGFKRERVRGLRKFRDRFTQAHERQSG
ncbi:hypothetical protein NP05234_10790 [Helicobacter pylori]